MSSAKPEEEDQTEPDRLAVLDYAKQHVPDVVTKTGFLLGLGETDDEIAELLDDYVAVNVDILTIEQYLEPTAKQGDLKRYVTPDDFDAYGHLVGEKGIGFVVSTPLLQSSYRAAKAIRSTYIETCSTDVYDNFAMESYLTAVAPRDEMIFLFWRTTPTLMIREVAKSLRRS